MSFLDAEHNNSTYTPRGCLLMMGVLSLGVLGCISVLLVSIDVSCHNAAQVELVDYPGSELVSEEWSLLRPFGLGETTRILYSADESREVRIWYQQYRTRLSADGQIGRSIANLRFRVEDASGGEGSTIVLYSDCARTAF